jgi:putative transposase
MPLAAYQELCRELAASGPGTFGELDSAGARSVLRRYSDSWFATARRRRDGDASARYPRRRRGKNARETTIPDELGRCT